MADTGVKKEHAALEEVAYDDEEVALVSAATEPAVEDDDPAEEVDLVLATGPGGKSEAQMNGVMVLSLLDKIIGVVDQIQQTQNGLEARQEAMEKSVSSIQGELTKLSKNHVGTTNTVNKMLDKVRKVSVNVKTVRSNLEKQAGQIKKLESNENELLKRRNFKVLIYQVRWWWGGYWALSIVFLMSRESCAIYRYYIMILMWDRHIVIWHKRCLLLGLKAALQ